MAAEIRYTLTEQDYSDAARSQYWHRVKSPRQWAWAIAALTLLSALFAYSETSDLESFVYNLIPYLLLFLIICPLIVAVSYAWAGRYARRMFKQQASKPENRVSWSDEGLRVESELGSLNAKWSDFYGWRNSGHTYMIHMNELLYYLIPGGALSAEQAADLEKTLVRQGVVRR